MKEIDYETNPSQINQIEITYDTPRSTQPDLFVELSVYHDGVYVWPTAVINNPDDSTFEVYQRAINQEFGVINVAPSTDYQWNIEQEKWELIPELPQMPIVLTENNTIVNTNGYVMTASPVIELYHDGSIVAVTDEAKNANITAVRVFKGRYVIKGVLGTHEDEKWAIEAPTDLNGQPLVWVNYKVAYQGEDINGDGTYFADLGDIVVDTYHRTYPNAPIFAQNNLWLLDDGSYIRAEKLPNGIAGELVQDGADIDIPSGKGQFLNIRVNVYNPE